MWYVLSKVVLEIMEIYREFKLILERGIGFAPMTSYLVGKHSTTELPIAFMAVLIGFEPITIRVEAEYSIQLNYKRIYFLVHDVGIEPTQLYLVRVAKSHSSSIVHYLVVFDRIELSFIPYQGIVLPLN